MYVLYCTIISSLPSGENDISVLWLVLRRRELVVLENRTRREFRHEGCV